MKSLNWRDACKFLSGVAFASCAINLYFFVNQDSIPFLKTMGVDDSLAGKASVALGLFAALFYLGFCTRVQRSTETVFRTETTRPSGIAPLTTTQHVA
jgi:hypothetical protein